MNIGEAKETIKNTVGLYLRRNEFGEYEIPVVRQRPIFLLGAPGIGKTAIMEQIAQEMGIALVSYSMTHHTRQSALGLPFITQKTYQGEEYSVSEYTMSEIIASVYETMENSGIREGILFLDEINCVSETLAPSMLQFLQYKIFGRHQVPDGWVIVTAGNPPEYNKSVREFDVVTMDRLKVLEVEADYRTWREYAAEKHLHGAVLNFLDLKKEYFYVMELSAKGRNYVTARGWEDLSQILKLYEEEELKVSEQLFGQYLRNDRVVKEFAAYYDLYNKYKKDYKITEILEGRPPQNALARAKAARFDERISLIGMLLDRVSADMAAVMEQADVISGILPLLRTAKERSVSCNESELSAMLSAGAEGKRKSLTSLKNAGSLSDKDRKKTMREIGFLEEAQRGILLAGAESGKDAFAAVNAQYDRYVSGMKKESERVQGELKSMLEFAREAFAEGNELLILVTELTVGNASSRFIGTFGSEEYTKLSGELMITERREQLQEQLRELKL